MTTAKRLLQSGVDLIHEILILKVAIPEKLRLKLAAWRTLVEMTEDFDSNSEGED